VHGEGTDSAEPSSRSLDQAAVAAGDAQQPGREFYDDVEDSNFDCPYYHDGRNHCPPSAEYYELAEPEDSKDRVESGDVGEASVFDEPCEVEANCEGWCDDDNALRSVNALCSVEDALSDWRHSAGNWVVLHLNAGSDGLEETEAGELDWTAVAAEARREQAVHTESPSDHAWDCGEENRSCGEQEDAEDADGDWLRPHRRGHEATLPVDPSGHENDTYYGPYQRTDPCHGLNDDWRNVRDEAGDDLGESRQPGRLRQWCGEAWQAVKEAAQQAGRRLEQMAEEALNQPKADENPGVEDAAEPRADQSQPPLPDYFLPQFGSPWDGCRDL
jgi:hypothetical protein